MSETKRAIVIGGGIGGLAAALALQGRGLDVEIYEQAPELREVGAGLTLSRGSLRALDALGVIDDVRANSLSSTRMPFLHFRSGALLWGTHDYDDGRAPSPPYSARQIYRADLQELLARAVRTRAPGALRLGRKLVGVDQDGSRVVATFHDGTSATADLLIGADGLRSNVRPALWGEDAARFTGQVAWRFLTDGAQARPFLGAGRAALFIGPGKVFNRYTLRDGSVLNCVAIVESDSWREEGWSTPGDPRELVDLFADWHSDVSALTKLARPGHLIKWALYDREPLKEWTRGRVTLLGDAAHPMTPFLGLGAAMAIEDAAVLGRAFEQEPDDVESALRRYSAARLPRTLDVAETSRRQGVLLQSQDPDRFDDSLLRIANTAFFEYDPLAVAV
jgi:salicylate hydroxylase